MNKKTGFFERIGMIVERIGKLIDVKSLVTLGCAACFINLSLEGKEPSSEFLTIFTMIIGFYFGTKKNKNNNESETNDTEEEPK